MNPIDSQDQNCYVLILFTIKRRGGEGEGGRKGEGMRKGEREDHIKFISKNYLLPLN